MNESFLQQHKMKKEKKKHRGGWLLLENLTPHFVLNFADFVVLDPDVGHNEALNAISFTQISPKTS